MLRRYYASNATGCTGNSFKFKRSKGDDRSVLIVEIDFADSALR